MAPSSVADDAAAAAELDETESFFISADSAAIAGTGPYEAIAAAAEESCLGGVLGLSGSYNVMPGPAARGRGMRGEIARASEGKRAGEDR